MLNLILIRLTILSDSIQESVKPWSSQTRREASVNMGDIQWGSYVTITKPLRKSGQNSSRLKQKKVQGSVCSEHGSRWVTQV
ncbi:hypothetical protein JTE90_019893 [Oedothorax gibbosus]|uniref:Uncharacterized protein n=1 Tax=Oedothorax gibbosus TaxID=931172 RepID=A0AAV6VX72_9ARAC|nr:hypothetical protein JTE90_019893 [Oedothorax gibbosus]